jgi:hypothetical protein
LILDSGWKLSCYEEGDDNERRINKNTTPLDADPDDQKEVESSLSSSSTAIYTSARRLPPFALEKEYYHRN